MTSLIQFQCLELRRAYEEGLLGNQTMPEDTHPEFATNEERLSYFTLPMSLNYQRNSYALWEAAKKTFDDPATHLAFDITRVQHITQDELRDLLARHKVALQPNKHTHTWHTISMTIVSNWGSIEALLESADFDFLNLQQLIQKDYKKGFPYLSGPKIFHYWSYILGEYCGVLLKNREYIQVAPDTHVIKCSVKLGILTEQEAANMTRELISERWREILEGSGISPCDMHSPLWFWSKNGFAYSVN